MILKGLSLISHPFGNSIFSLVYPNDGDLHTYAWLLSIFWVLSVLCAIRGLALQRRPPSTKDG
jgi:hypothetical protein